MKKILLLCLLAINFHLFSQSWVNTTSAINYNFYGIHFQEDSTGWAVSFNPAMIYTTNNYGASWVFNKYIPNILLKTVTFFNDSVGIVGGNSALNGHPVLYRTTDKGANWAQVTLPNTATWFGINGFLKRDSLHAIAYGNNGYLISTNTAGASWNIFFMGAIINSHIWGMDVSPSAPAVYAACNNGLHRTTPLGMLATDFTNQAHDVIFKNGQGYVVGDTNFWYSSGLGWVRSYVPLSQSQVNDIAVDDSGRVFASTHRNKIFRSDDNGQSWVQETPTNNNYNLFDIICFKNDLWAVGSNGRILKRQLVTSINYPEKEELSTIFYPNPFSRQLNLKQEFERVEIYNLSGKLLRTYRDPKGSLATENLPSGLYLVKAFRGDEIFTKKLIKQD